MVGGIVSAPPPSDILLGSAMSRFLSSSPPCGNSDAAADHPVTRSCDHPIVCLLCLMLATCALAPCAAQDMTQSAHVILISIDTLRADHLSAYGYTKIHTPHIDSFAAGGTIFTQAEAQVPLTLPSHT